MDDEILGAAIGVLGGLVLFLHGVNRLSDTLFERIGHQAKSILSRSTSHLLSAVLTGAVVTVLLDSSSAVIVLAIVLVNARALTLRQAMGIALGANIGTTAGSQLIALNIAEYAPIIMLPGFLLMFSKNQRREGWGRGLFYAGLLFFGLDVMENAVYPLQASQRFEHWMSHTENPWQGAGMGALITLIIQSSSATVGMAIVLVKQQLLSLTGAVAVMLGAELGTCGSSLLATIHGSRTALKTGIFHFIFNASFISAGLLLFDPFVSGVAFVSEGSDPAQQLALAHFGFNAISVLTIMPFVPLIEKLLNWMLPEKG